jgi:hypothetical protein
MASGRRRSIAIEIGEGRLAVPRSLAVMLVSAYGQDALSFTNDDGGLTPSAMIPDTLPQWPSIRWACHRTVLDLSVEHPR